MENTILEEEMFDVYREEFENISKLTEKVWETNNYTVNCNELNVDVAACNN